MFLSRLILNTRRAEARTLLALPQNMHAAIMSSFSAYALEETKAFGRPLWRIDQRGIDTVIYVSSPSKPDFRHLLEQAGRVNDPYGVVIKDYTPVLRGLSQGTQYRFKAALNPVSMVSGKRVPHITETHKKNWLITKLDLNGFDLQFTEFENTFNESLRFDKYVAGKKMKVVLEKATFQGKLTVTDPELLQRAICFGIGKGKAYGLGMITLGKL